MCFYHNKNSKKLTAKKDKTVYKIVRLTYKGEIESEIKCFKYKLNKVYNTEFRKVRYPDDIGFHSIINEPKIINTYEISCRRNYLTKNVLEYAYGCVIVKCTIPKGTKYYSNGVDCISESIRLDYIIFDDEKTSYYQRRLIEKYYPNIKRIK